MSTSPLRAALLLGLAALLVPACGTSGGGTAGTGGATGQGPVFPGVGNADAISPTEILVFWSDAFSSTGGNSASMVYKVFRATDPVAVLLETQPIHTTAPGVTAYLDTGLQPFTTYYYRVVAMDSAGRESLVERVVSARTPSLYDGPGVSNINYAVDVAPFWGNMVSPQGNSCLSCHDGSPAGGRLDLSTYEGVLAGVGTLAEPDSFVIPFDPDGTWGEFILRFDSNPVEHLEFVPVIGQLATLEPVLRAWVQEGALQFPDRTPPAFEFDDIQNAGKYYAEWKDFQTVRVTWFHASDLESLPPSGSTLNQIEYHVYAGEDSASIDWEHPVAVVMSPEKLPGNDTISAEFTWLGSRVTIVVRALDAAGRSVAIPPGADPADPAFRDLFKLRWRNMSVNEREIGLRR